MTPTQLKNKVAEITQDRITPFKDGIPGQSWMRWFRARHPELVLRMPQGLDYKRARVVNPETVAIFFGNLEALYLQHNYPQKCIWNADESGCQANQNGLSKVFAKRGIRGVHQVIPSEREWLSILSAINASGGTIPNYYIFKGVRKFRDYTALCEEGAPLGMQKKGWMDTIHFMEWMDHFIHKLESQDILSQEKRHLLILDGHKSHMSLDILLKAKEHGIDMLSLPSHTSHELQPLDKACFRPFMVAFRAYRDVWLNKNSGCKCLKEDLAHWASLALKKALTRKNIQSGFRATGIWPLNPQALELRTGPSTTFEEDVENQEQREEILEEGIPPADMTNTHYYGTEEDIETAVEEDEGMEASQSPRSAKEEENHITKFLKLPRPLRRALREGRAEPLIDYSQSQMLTLDEHLATLKSIATQKQKVQELKVQKLKEREIMMTKKAEERLINKKRREEAKEARRVAKELEALEKALKKKKKGKRGVILSNVVADGKNLQFSLPLRMENTVPCSSNGLFHAGSASTGGPPSQWQSSFSQWSSSLTPPSVVSSCTVVSTPKPCHRLLLHLGRTHMKALCHLLISSNLTNVTPLFTSTSFDQSKPFFTCTHEKETALFGSFPWRHRHESALAHLVLDVDSRTPLRLCSPLCTCSSLQWRISSMHQLTCVHGRSSLRRDLSSMAARLGVVRQESE